MKYGTRAEKKRAGFANRVKPEEPKTQRYMADDGAHLPHRNIEVSEADAQGTGLGVPASKASHETYEAGMPKHGYPTKTQDYVEGQDPQPADPEQVNWLKALKGIG